jgi:hypothetical protein
MGSSMEGEAYLIESIVKAVWVCRDLLICSRAVSDVR